MPCSTLRLSVKVLVGAAVNFSPGFFCSVITVLGMALESGRRARRPLGRVAGSETLEAAPTGQDRFACGPGQEGSMYHIWAAERQIQMGGRKTIYDHGFGPMAP